jgi:hypothetical protein
VVNEEVLNQDESINKDFIQAPKPVGSLQTN